MNEEFDYTSPEEEALLHFLGGLLEKLPKNTMWIINPANYKRIAESVNQILTAVHKVSPSAKHTISFDELVGTGLCLTIRDWTFSFYGCKEFSEAVSLADTLDIEANLDGEVVLMFGFNDARIPIVSRKEDSPNT